MNNRENLDNLIGDHGSASRWAEFYRFRGYQPLPSDPRSVEDGGGKRPLMRYAQWWEDFAPLDLFDRFPTTNLQVMTGRFWGLLVIDLDGPEAIERWPLLAPCCPRTWITHSGGGGRHLWFSVAKEGPPMPKAVLWRVDPTKPRVKGEPAIERLCDRSLVMAPPSFHPRTGRRYQFLAGSSPKQIARPANCPPWILGLKPIEAPRVESPSAVRVPRITPTTRYGASVRTEDVLAAILDKTALAQSWGLRIASLKPNAAGWCPCHAIGREDGNPSASFSPSSGRYWEPGLRTVNLLDLGVRLGVYADWKDARDDLAGRFIGVWKKGNSIPLSSVEEIPPLTQATT